MGLAAPWSPGTVTAPCWFSHVPVGAEQKILPLRAVDVQPAGSSSSRLCTAGVNGNYFPYLNLLLEMAQRAAVLKLKGATKGNA